MKAPLVFFGWGQLLEECFDELVGLCAVKPDFICDSDATKHGRYLRGVPCIGVEQLKVLAEPSVVITLRSYWRVVSLLHECGISDVKAGVFSRAVHKVVQLRSVDGTPEPHFRSRPSGGRRIAITGASRGLGKEVALYLAANGFNLLLHARRLEHLREVETACKTFGAQVDCLAGDLGLDVDVERLAEQFQAVQIDGLINNAAISPPIVPGNFLDIPRDHFLDCFKVNFLAVQRLTTAVLRQWLPTQRGDVITISTDLQGRADTGAYAVSKAAVDKWILDVASTLRESPVSLSLVDPGAIATDMSGGAGAQVASAVTGVVLPLMIDLNFNGQFLHAQDFVGLSGPDFSARLGFVLGHLA